MNHQEKAAGDAYESHWDKLQNAEDTASDMRTARDEAIDAAFDEWLNELGNTVRSNSKIPYHIVIDAFMYLYDDEHAADIYEQTIFKVMLDGNASRMEELQNIMHEKLRLVHKRIWEKEHEEGFDPSDYEAF